jgi:mannose-6-phosphate isomerase-like protein (cupin superfamily)
VKRTVGRTNRALRALCHHVSLLSLSSTTLLDPSNGGDSAALAKDLLIGKRRVASGQEPSLPAEEGSMKSEEAIVDVFERARQNEAFRREVATGPHSQLVVMTIPPGGEIGEEVHEHVDQILLFVEGDAEAILDGERATVGRNDLVFVRAGTRHNFVNAGERALRLATIYSPPEHEPGTVHGTKEEAEAAEGR